MKKATKLRARREAESAGAAASGGRGGGGSGATTGARRAESLERRGDVREQKDAKAWTGVGMGVGAKTRRRAVLEGERGGDGDEDGVT